MPPNYNMKNMTCLITGSTSGIGRATAFQLARMNGHVIVHGRKEAACQNTRREIIKNTGNKKVDYVFADLSLMKEVDRMAKGVEQRFIHLNVLVNNAGTFSIHRQITPEGIELTWAVNYLSRFLFTNRLIDLLTKNAPSRIINVAGAYHAKGRIHFDDVRLEKNYSYQRANSQSKLADVLFTYKLAEKLKGTGVTVNCLHPGAVNTGSVLRAKDISWIMKCMYRLMSVFLKSPEQGAETSVYLASSPEVKGISSRYFVNKKERESAPQTYDKELQDKLWTLSEEMIDKIVL